MADYREHLKLLVKAFLVLLTVFLISAMFRWEDFWRPTVFSIALTLMAILLLSKFGGDAGRTQ